MHLFFFQMLTGCTAGTGAASLSELMLKNSGMNRKELFCRNIRPFCVPLTKQLLSKPKFSGVEKIKTIGSTYMAAAGLSGTPGQENNQVE